MSDKPADLSEFTSRDLELELRRRREEELRLQQEEEQRVGTIVLENIEVFLAIVTEHSRRSCSDESPYNANDGCTRCALLDIQSIRYFDTERFSVCLEIRRKR